MTYLVALLGVVFGVAAFITFVLAYGRRLEGRSGPWIVGEGRRHD
jgi:hypothetical protein